MGENALVGQIRDHVAGLAKGPEVLHLFSNSCAEVGGFQQHDKS